jgi:hypothetical protein
VYGRAQFAQRFFAREKNVGYEKFETRAKGAAQVHTLPPIRLASFFGTHGDLSLRLQTTGKGGGMRPLALALIGVLLCACRPKQPALQARKFFEFPRKDIYV